MNDSHAASLRASARARVLPVLAFLVLLTLAIRVPLLSIPFERDEGEYSYIAWRMGYGELPYRDWVDQKPPGIFWVYRAALALPVDPIRSVHFMALLFSAASSCALYFVARRFVNRPWLEAGVALFAVLSAHPVIQGTAANTEVFMLLPLILSLAAFFSAVGKGGRGTFFMLLSGVLTGVAVAFKQVAAVNWLFLIAAYPLFCARERRVRETLSFAAWSTLGLAVVWGLLGVYFLLQHGFKDFVYNVLTHNLDYIRALPFETRWKYLLRTLRLLAPVQGLLWLCGAAGFAALWRAGRRQGFLFLAAWLVASAVGASASGYYFPHYFQQLLPALALAGALGAESLCGARFWSRFSALVREPVLILLLAMPPAVTIFPFLFVYSPVESVGKIYPGLVGTIFGEMPEVGKRIAQITSPEDRLFVFGADPEVLFYARRVSATRYIFLFPLFGPYGDAREKQMAVAKEVFLSAPAAALYMPTGDFVAPGNERFLWDWSRSYLGENFRPDTYFTVDTRHAGHLISGEDNLRAARAEGQKLTGTIFVRKHGAAVVPE